jgi:hypothetical protein
MLRLKQVWNAVRYRENFGPGNFADKENRNAKIPSIYLK